LVVNHPLAILFCKGNALWCREYFAQAPSRSQAQRPWPLPAGQNRPTDP
jgi:hypothetical protein